jgi:hypothetical protein
MYCLRHIKIHNVKHTYILQVIDYKGNRNREAISCWLLVARLNIGNGLRVSTFVGQALRTRVGKEGKSAIRKSGLALLPYLLQ